MENNREPKKLPVQAIFAEAFALPQKHFSALVKYGLPVFISWLLVQMAVSPLFEEKVDNMLISGTLVFIFMLCLVVGIVSCHRIFLLDDRVAQSTAVVRWTMRETRYLISWILIGLATLLVALPAVFIMGTVLSSVGDNEFLKWLIQIVLLIPMMYIASRWAILLPAVAVDSEKRGMAHAWELSKDNGWRLTLLICLPAIISDQTATLFENSDALLVNVLAFVVWLVLGVIELAILSLSYAWLRDNCSPEEDSQAEDSQPEEVQEST